jgi:hypothetical protein
MSPISHPHLEQVLTAMILGPVSIRRDFFEAGLLFCDCFHALTFPYSARNVNIYFQLFSDLGFDPAAVNWSGVCVDFVFSFLQYDLAFLAIEFISDHGGLSVFGIDLCFDNHADHVPNRVLTVGRSVF